MAFNPILRLSPLPCWQFLMLCMTLAFHVYRFLPLPPSRTIAYPYYNLRFSIDSGPLPCPFLNNRLSNNRKVECHGHVNHVECNGIISDHLWESFQNRVSAPHILSGRVNAKDCPFSNPNPSRILRLPLSAFSISVVSIPFILLHTIAPFQPFFESTAICSIDNSASSNSICPCAMHHAAMSFYSQCASINVP